MKNINTKALILKSVSIGFVLCFLFSMLDFDAKSNNISDSILRLHILANSDSAEDQNLKLAVRDEVSKYCSSLFADVSEKSRAKKIISQHMNEIVEIARKEVYNKGYDYDVKGELVNMYFTNRTYENITLPAGFYDAVRITVGSGNGHNWWCVMFPPICVGACDKIGELSDVLDPDEVNMVSDNKYCCKFKIYEVYQNFVNKIDKEE